MHLTAKIRTWLYKRSVRRDLERQAREDPEFFDRLSDFLNPPDLPELKRQSQERDRRIAASEDVSGGEMFLIRPEKARGARVKWDSRQMHLTTHQSVLEDLVRQVQAIVEESGRPEGFNARSWVEDWLGRPSPALRGRRPEEFLDTPEVLHELLARMQSGAYL